MAESNITINREKNYGAFEMELVVKAGTDLEVFETKVALDLNITGATLALTTSLVGVKIEGKLLAGSFVFGKGTKVELLSGFSFDDAQARAGSVLAEAEVLLTETRSVLTNIENSVASLRSSVTEASKTRVAVKTGTQVVI